MADTKKRKDVIQHINYKFDDYINELEDIRKKYTNPKYKKVYDAITKVIDKMVKLYTTKLSYQQDNDIGFEVNEIRVNY